MVNVDSWWDGLLRDRFAAVLELVLCAISDDYESVEIILQSINGWEAGCEADAWPARNAIPLARQEVIRALRELTHEGYAQAFVLTPQETRIVDFREGEIEALWFYATRKGISAVRQLRGSE